MNLAGHSLSFTLQFRAGGVVRMARKGDQKKSFCSETLPRQDSIRETFKAASDEVLKTCDSTPRRESRKDVRGEEDNEIVADEDSQAFWVRKFTQYERSRDSRGPCRWSKEEKK